MLASDYRITKCYSLNIWLPVMQPGTIKGVIVPGIYYTNEFNLKCTKSLAIRKSYKARK